MKSLTRRIQDYFQEPEQIHNSWIDVHRAWPASNVILLSACLICFILTCFGVKINSHVIWPVYLVSLASVLGELLHFFFTT